MSGSSRIPPSTSPVSFSSPNPHTSRKHPTTPPKSDAVAPSQSTPVAPKLSTSRIYTSLHFQRDYEMRQLGSEMEGKFVGPMPIRQFLDEFLHIPSIPLPWHTSSSAAFQIVTQQSTEPAMYIPLINALRPFCPSLEIIDTHGHPDTASGNLKPDIVAYSQDCGRSGITDFSKMEIHLELKFSEHDDAFLDWKPGDTHSFERDTELDKDTKGQIASYAAAHLALQFRTFIYSVLLCGHGERCFARILRWDRSGAVVTEAFPLQSNHLADFFWRYDHLSVEARGVDVSVSPASGSDASNARIALHLPQDAPLVNITAANTDDDGIATRYIASKPAFSFNFSATGRSTRGFVSYDPQNDVVVYLKDTWRLDVDGIRKEGTIYKTLHRNEIPHIAPCIMSGDVRNHRTQAQEFTSHPWTCNVNRRQLVAHIHYRLVLGVVGAVLNSFSSTRELVVAVGDAFEAHKLAWEKASILHRDISVGNILIVQGGRGLLIDWDLCKHKSDLRETARREERTGTWQFMAARLLLSGQNESIQHTLQDDLESFIHVLGWVALRFTSHTMSGSELADMLTDIFDRAFVDENGRTRGGRNKKNALLLGTIPPLVAMHSPRFRTLLQELTETCSVRYATHPTEAAMDNYQKVLEKAQQYDDSIISNFVAQSEVAIYLQRKERIRNSDWMLEKLRGAVADSEAEKWPKSDSAVQNVVSNLDKNPSKRKRKAHEELVGQHMPARKHRHSPAIPDELGESDSE